MHYRQRTDSSMQVKVYRSSLKDGMYMYMQSETTLDTVPAAVMKQLGEPEQALEFELTASRELPNADASEVLATIENQGFYIQMPADIDVEAILERVSNESTQPK